MPTATIYQNLKHIVEDTSPPPKFPVAALTTENRDTWANIRRALQVEPDNEEALRLIDSAIFVLCLDDHGVQSVADVTRTFLHGDGTNRLDMSLILYFKVYRSQKLSVLKVQSSTKLNGQVQPFPPPPPHREIKDETARRQNTPFTHP